MGRSEQREEDQGKATTTLLNTRNKDVTGLLRENINIIISGAPVLLQGLVRAVGSAAQVQWKGQEHPRRHAHGGTGFHHPDNKVLRNRTARLISRCFLLLNCCFVTCLLALKERSTGRCCAYCVLAGKVLRNRMNGFE